jgi:DNA-binding FadR family transcriptional regulator
VKLSKKMRETLRVLVRCRDSNGITPTHRELGKLLGVTTNAVRFRLSTLARAGHIVLIPRSARGIIVMKSGESVARSVR